MTSQWCDDHTPENHFFIGCDHHTLNIKVWSSQRLIWLILTGVMITPLWSSQPKKHRFAEVWSSHPNQNLALKRGCDDHTGVMITTRKTVILRRHPRGAVARLLHPRVPMVRTSKPLVSQSRKRAISSCETVDNVLSKRHRPCRKKTYKLSEVISMVSGI